MKLDYLQLLKILKKAPGVFSKSEFLGGGIFKGRGYSTGVYFKV